MMKLHGALGEGLIGIDMHDIVLYGRFDDKDVFDQRL